jgi:hypothetical protein
MSKAVYVAYISTLGVQYAPKSVQRWIQLLMHGV